MVVSELVGGALGALDEAIAAVARREYDRLTSRGSLDKCQCQERVKAAFDSLDRLQSPHRKPDYEDWDSLFYLAWHQPRQVHLAYSVFRCFWESGRLRVIDVACGAWALRMALAILGAERVQGSLDGRVAVHGIDSSASMRRLGEELWIEWWSRAEARGLHGLVDTMDAMTSSSGTYDSYEDWADSASARDAQLPDVRWWLTAVHGVHGQTRPQIGELYDQIYDMLAVAPCELATSHGSKEGLVGGLIGDVKVRQFRPTSV